MVEFSWGYTKERKRKSAIFDSGENVSGRECIRERIRTIYIRTKPILTYLPMPLGEEFTLCLKGSILGTPEIGKGAWLSFLGVIRKKERKKRYIWLGRECIRERMYPGDNQDYIYTDKTYSNILSDAARGGISPVF